MKSSLPRLLTLLMGVSAPLLSTQSSAINPLYDLTLGAQGATFPRSFSFYSEAGISQLLWGKVSPLMYQYGYLRLALRANVSGLINRLEYKLDLFPISIAGITVGQIFSVRSPWFNHNFCPGNDNICGGMETKSYLLGQAIAGTGPYFLLLRGRVASVTINNPSTARFWDDTIDLIAHGSSDHTLQSEAFLGRRCWDEWRLGVLSYSGLMVGSGQHTDTEAFFARWSRGNWIVAGGMGTYYSTPRGRGLTVGLNILWMPYPTPTLF